MDRDEMKGEIEAARHRITMAEIEDGVRASITLTDLPYPLANCTPIVLCALAEKCANNSAYWAKQKVSPFNATMAAVNAELGEALERMARRIGAIRYTEAAARDAADDARAAVLGGEA